MERINWFPGHMHKARKEIAQLMDEVDIVIEVLDARLPRSSENPLVTGQREPKPAIREAEVHYQLGWVRKTTGNYDRDIQKMNSKINLADDKKRSNFGRGKTEFPEAPIIKNHLYRVPPTTSISSQIKIKS